LGAQIIKLEPKAKISQVVKVSPQTQTETQLNPNPDYETI